MGLRSAERNPRSSPELRAVKVAFAALPVRRDILPNESPGAQPSQFEFSSVLYLMHDLNNAVENELD